MKIYFDNSRRSSYITVILNKVKNPAIQCHSKERSDEESSFCVIIQFNSHDTYQTINNHQFDTSV